MITGKFLSGDLIFSWTQSQSNLSYIVYTRRNKILDKSTHRTNHTKYTVRDVLRYNDVSIDVIVNENKDWGRQNYKGMI